MFQNISEGRGILALCMLVFWYQFIMSIFFFKKDKTEVKIKTERDTNKKKRKFKLSS